MVDEPSPFVPKLQRADAQLHHPESFEVSSTERLSEFKAENLLLGKLVQDLKRQVDCAIDGKRSAEAKATAASQQAAAREAAVAAAARDAKECQAALKKSKAEHARLHHAKLEADAVALDLQTEVQRLVERATAAEEEREELKRRLQKALNDGARWEERSKVAAAAAADGAEAVQALAAARAEAEEARREAAAAAQRHQGECERVHAALHAAVSDREAADQRWRGELQRVTAAVAADNEKAIAERGTVASITREHNQLVRQLMDKLETAQRQARAAQTALTAREAVDAATHNELAQLRAKVNRLREEMVQATDRTTRLLEGAGDEATTRAAAQQQLAAAEAALWESRTEAATLRSELWRAEQRLRKGEGEAAARAAERFLKVRVEAESDALRDDPREVYVRVLEHDLHTERAAVEQLRQEVAHAHYMEAQTQHLLHEARKQQTQLCTTVQLEKRRVLELECLRLTDLRELHRLETEALGLGLGYS